MGRVIWAALSRSAQIVVFSLLVASLCFVLVQTLPGDLALKIAAARYGEQGTTTASAERVRAEGALDRPALTRWGDWVTDLARLDLGRSLVSGEPVSRLFGDHLAKSWRLALAATLIGLTVAIPVGVLAGQHPGSPFDTVSAFLASALMSMPTFLVGLLLIVVVSLRLHLLPPAGFGEFRHLILPGLAVGLRGAAPLSRVVRNAVAATHAAPYLVFARSKGLPEPALVRLHVLRNAAIPVVTFAGLQAAHLLEGVVAAEVLFAYPGIGKLILDAVLARDIPVVQGVALVVGGTFLVINAVTDMGCLLLDPRQRLGRVLA